MCYHGRCPGSAWRDFFRACSGTHGCGVECSDRALRGYRAVAQQEVVALPGRTCSNASTNFIPSSSARNVKTWSPAIALVSWAMRSTACSGSTWVRGRSSSSVGRVVGNCGQATSSPSMTGMKGWLHLTSLAYEAQALRQPQCVAVHLPAGSMRRARLESSSNFAQALAISPSIQPLSQPNTAFLFPARRGSMHGRRPQSLHRGPVACLRQFLMFGPGSTRP